MEKTPSQIEAWFLSEFNVTLLPTHKFTTVQDAKTLLKQTQIEELLFSKTSLDGTTGQSTLPKDLLLEVKQVRNVSKPYQRATDAQLIDEEPKEQKIGPKKGTTYQLISHDGVRLVKIVLLFGQQGNFVQKMHENNKFICKKGTSLTRPDGTMCLLLDSPDQLQEWFCDKKSPRLQESYYDIKGLPIKYTNAPKFKFLNSKKGAAQDQMQYDEVEQLEEEVEDENADLYKQFDIPDLSATERAYLARFQQLGFWRKKFNN